MIRKIISFFITLSLVLCVFGTKTLIIRADDDSCDYENECSESDNACKKKAAQKKINCLEDKMSTAQADKDAYAALATQWAQEAETLNTQIAQLQPQIDELSTKITNLETSIAEKEDLVSELNNRVLTRMESAQATMHFSPMLDFLLGSNGFSDMLRRLYGIEAINAKEEQDRKELEDVIKALNEEKTELDASKVELDAKMTDLQIAQDEAEYKKQQANEASKQIQEEIDAMLNEQKEAIDIRDSIKVDISQMVAQSGFSSPVPGSTISSGFPYYPTSFGGGVHLGIDYAVTIGSAIYAPADGVIIISDDSGCADYGYLGNSCGGYNGGVSYGGNQIYFLCSVGGTVFALTFSHLMSGSLHGIGTVTQGTQIARAASSGNSTGPHCHIEMYYLGEGENEDLQSYVNMLSSGAYSKSFNCGWGSAALSTICDVKGSAPCRLDGSQYLPG